MLPMRALSFVSGLSLTLSPAMAQPADSARAALVRLGLPAQAWDLRVKRAAQPSYRVTVHHGRIAARGSSPVALVHGLAQVLQRQGRLSLSWEGDRHASLRGLPDWTAARSLPFALRAYLNTCTFGYTSPWWDWARWSREIDLMAARGVDTPLAMEGQEYVWAQLWRESGLADGEIAASLSAAPFLPWQRMGNIAGYRAPLSATWIARKHRLQGQILARMRALGMKPILPAFSGYVPEAFARRHPEARIYRMRAWEGFPGTYWLDPSDPLFARLARRFIEIYTKTYGPGEYYLADAFNEMVPPIAEDGSDAAKASYGDSTANSAANSAATRAAALPPQVRDARLAAYGERLYASITAAAPRATWVMQGWLFGADKAFWTPEAIRAFLSRVPDERMLILDIGNDRYPGIWARTDAFDGKNWVYGYVHNYGGSNPVYGDLEFYRRDLGALAGNPQAGHLRGFGLFPEGLHSNSLVYAYAYDLAWGQSAQAPLAGWLRPYLRSRYGAASPALVAAWQDIVRGAYATRYWSPRWWQEEAGAYLLFKRPSLLGADYPPAPGDRAALHQGLAALIAAAPRPGRACWPMTSSTSPGTRPACASIKTCPPPLPPIAPGMWRGRCCCGPRQGAGAGYRRADRRAAGNARLVAGAGPRLWHDASRAGQLRDAGQGRRHGLGWAGHLSDYASRAWQGLYRGYYWPRWALFLEDQRAAAIAHRPFDEATSLARIRAFEQAWLSDGKLWPGQAPANPAAAVARVLAEADHD
jgi:alpha-N-acetylglucosaminidase